MATDSDEIDELFEVPLAEFTAKRTELARELKSQGDTELAAEVAGMRKPTVPVWLANQLARRHRREVDLLLDAGHRLRSAHGESDPEQARDAFQRAHQAEREAMKRLGKAAEELLRGEQGKASSAMVDRALATLRAAAVTEEGRELLARGRLTEELATTGFELAASLVPAAPPGKKRAPRKASKQGAVRSARAELKAAKEVEREVSRRLREAERRAAQARKELDAAEADAEEARSEAEQAGKAVSAAESALKRAQRGT